MKLKSLLFAGAMVFLLGRGVYAEESIVRDVQVHTRVLTTGQYPEEFVVTLSETAEDLKISPEDFILKGKASSWGTDSLHDMECGFSEAKLNGNVLTLVPDSFPEKYFYVEEWAVTCNQSSSLSFTKAQVSKTTTEIADDFETIEDEEHGFFYHLYSPDTETPCPVVVVFHGYGDTHNLLTYRTSVAWAESEMQKKRPCYVISPVIENDSYGLPARRDEIITAVYDKIQSMIAEGKADAQRIYVMGNSFGGMTSIEFAEKYPEQTAAVLALCPALSYSANAISNLDKMVSVPVWFAHAEHDKTISSSQSEKAYKILQEAGNESAKLKIYSDEEMDAAGAFPSSESTYSYHHVELAVMEDETYMDWMFGN